jgi:hypothetical protein
MSQPYRVPVRVQTAKVATYGILAKLSTIFAVFTAGDSSVDLMHSGSQIVTDICGIALAVTRSWVRAIRVFDLIKPCGIT